MPKDYFFSDEAVEQFEEIFEYSKSNWGLSQAKKYATELEKRFSLLAGW